MNHSEQLSGCIMFFDEVATVRAHVSEAISQKPLILRQQHNRSSHSRCDIPLCITSGGLTALYYTYVINPDVNFVK